MSGFQSKRLMGRDRDNMPGITIHGLTPEQVQLLDIMWGFDELDDLEAWRQGLRPGLQRQVDDLIRLVIIEHLEAVVMKEEETLPNPYPDANAYLKKFRLQ